MKVLSLMVGPIMTNCYILCDEEAKVCAVIDPGDEPERIAAMIASSGCTPTMLLLTHGHFDHYTGVAGLLEKWPELPVYIHRADAVDGAGGELRFPRLGEKNQRYYKEGDKLTVGGLTLDVLETPGHSQGSVCLLVEGQRVMLRRRHAVPGQLRPVRLPRRRLPCYVEVSGPSGPAGGAVHRLSRPRLRHRHGL